MKKKAHYCRCISAILTALCMLIAMIPTAVIPAFATNATPKYMVHIKTVGGDQWQTFAIPLSVTAGKTYTFSFKSTSQVMNPIKNSTITKNGVLSQTVNATDYNITFDYDDLSGVNTATFTVPSSVSKVYVCLTQNYYKDNLGIYMTDFKLYEGNDTTNNLFDTDFSGKLNDWRIGTNYNNDGAVGKSSDTSLTLNRKDNNIDETTTINLLDYNGTLFGEEEPESEQYMVKVNTAGGNLWYSICIPLSVTAGKTYTFSFKSTAQVMTNNKDNTGICWNGSWSKKFTNGTEFSFNETTGINTAIFTVPTEASKGKVWVCMSQNYNNNGKGIYMADFKFYEGTDTANNLFDNAFPNKLGGWEIGASYSGGATATNGLTSFLNTSKDGVTLTVDLLAYDEIPFIPEPNAPTILNAENATVTLENKENCKYSIDKTNWQDSNIFTNLKEDTIYIFYVKDTITEKISEGIKFAFPSAPKVLLRGETILTLKKTEGFEYSSDNINWYATSDLNGLAENQTYTVYKRLKDSGYPVIATATAITDGLDALSGGSAFALTYVCKQILFDGASLAADVNGDLTVNILDLVRLKKKIANVANVDPEIVETVTAPNETLAAGSIVGEYYLFFSDPHIGPTQENSSIPQSTWDRFRELGYLYTLSGASFTLGGGDWLNNTNTKADAVTHLSEIRTNMTKIFGKNSYLVVGNHDYNYQYMKDGKIVASSYTLQPFEIANAWNFKNGKTYYSFESNASRFYVFDSGTDWGHATCNDYDNEQLAWYIESLENNDDKHIVLAPHSVELPVAIEAAKIAAVYNSRGVYTYNEVTYDFSQKTGMVEYIIAGHNHNDKIGDLSGIPYVLTATSRYTNVADFVYADYTNRKLTLIRVGDGESRTIHLIANN